MRTVALPVSAVGSSFAHGCALPPPDADQRAAWHRGRRRYAVWLIEADTPAVRALCARARERLAPWLGPAPRRQPHITLAACGFPVRVGSKGDAFDTVQRRAQRETLQAVAPATFALRVGGIGSFNSCAFLCVDDGAGDLQVLHRLLVATVPAARGQCFTPHVTLGCYREVVPLRTIAAVAESFLESAALPVTALTLAHYDPCVADSPLRPVLRVPLPQKR